MKNTKNYDDYAEMCGNCAFYFVATGLKCFMKLHKCVGHLLNYGAQVFLFLHIFLTFFFLLFGSPQGAGGAFSLNAWETAQLGSWVSR